MCMMGALMVVQEGSLDLLEDIGYIKLKINFCSYRTYIGI